mmetsp:Transcript_108243/g.305078  ORF Transcript_108243/g.305078 Transcript_108243/m.305078 type:complete len:250 (+) Transcript_108243:927-1676(+)
MEVLATMAPLPRAIAMAVRPRRSPQATVAEAAARPSRSPVARVADATVLLAAHAQGPHRRERQMLESFRRRCRAEHCLRQFQRLRRLRLMGISWSRRRWRLWAGRRSPELWLSPPASRSTQWVRCRRGTVPPWRITAGSLRRRLPRRWPRRCSPRSWNSAEFASPQGSDRRCLQHWIRGRGSLQVPRSGEFRPPLRPPPAALRFRKCEQTLPATRSSPGTSRGCRLGPTRAVPPSGQDRLSGEFEGRMV